MSPNEFSPNAYIIFKGLQKAILLNTYMLLALVQCSLIAALTKRAIDFSADIFEKYECNLIFKYEKWCVVDMGHIETYMYTKTIL